MEKKIRKMSLTRETLRTLDVYRLAEVQAGVGTRITGTVGPNSEGTGPCSICGIER